VIDGQPPSGTAVRGLRVLTLNVLALEHAEGGRRLAVLREELRRLRPDVAALQEVTRTEGYDQVLDLLGPGYTVIDHPGASPDGVGAALASRWPVRDTRRLDLHLTPRAVDLPWAAVVVAEVLAPAPLGPLLVVHHKPNWQHGREYEREQQAVAAARFVEQVAGEVGHDEREQLPVVLLGDFDAAPDAASIRFWTGRQSLDGTSVCYQDAWEAVHPGEAGHTFTPGNRLVRAGEMGLERGRRIDYVMVRCGPHGPALEVTGCRRVLDQPVDGVWASDHFGVLADLQLPPRPIGTWA
jgi:endonuclease/exonuclease/phosphatase family metal-dependent hydrolase